jgi:hypothetical protein
VQLFYLVNGGAGRFAWVDEAARLFYVSALPLLACALAWLLLVAPREYVAPGAAASLSPRCCRWRELLCCGRA